MKPEISVFMAIKNAFMGFSRHFHGIFVKKRFIVLFYDPFYCNMICFTAVFKIITAVAACSY